MEASHLLHAKRPLVVTPRDIDAIVRRAADILRLKGYRVFFYYPEGYQGGED